MIKRFGLLVALLFAVSSAWAANDFSGDTHLKAYYKFNNGAITTDSKSTNTLTDNGSPGTSDTTNKIEGNASLDLEADDGTGYFRTDTNLASGFPTKSTETNKTFSVLGFFRLESKPADGQFYEIVGKYDPANDKRSWRIEVGTTGTTSTLGFRLGSVDGTTSTRYSHTGALAVNIFYAYAVSYDDATGGYNIEVRNAESSCSDVATAATGTASPKITLFDYHFTIGFDGSGNNFDGKVDEFVIRDAVTSTSDAYDICRQVFGLSVTTTTTTTVATTTTTTTTLSVTTTTLDVDLEVFSLAEPPATANRGDSFTISNVVRNNGADTAIDVNNPIFTFLFLCPTQTFVVGQCRVVGLWSIASIAGTATLPANQTPVTVDIVGTYYLVARTDGGQVIAETDETNNDLASAGQITISDPTAYDECWSMRLTPGFVVDDTGCMPFTNNTYPTAIDGQTNLFFGMINGQGYSGAVFNDVDNTLDSRLAGTMVREEPLTAAAKFDLGGTQTTNTIYFLGGSKSANDQGCIRAYDGDDPTPFININQTFPQGTLVDATGVARPFIGDGADLFDNPQGVSHVFVNGFLKIEIGCSPGSHPNENTRLRWVRIVRTSATPPSTTTTTTVVTTTTTTTTVATTTTTNPVNGFCKTSTASFTPPAYFSDNVTPISGLQGHKFIVCLISPCTPANAIQTYDTQSTATSYVLSLIMGSLGNSAAFPGGVYYMNVAPYVSATNVGDYILATERAFPYTTSNSSPCGGPAIPTTTTTTTTTTTVTTTTTTTTTTSTTLAIGVNLRPKQGLAISSNQTQLSSPGQYAGIYDTENIGVVDMNPATDAFVERFYLSMDTTCDTGDIKIGEVNIPGLLHSTSTGQLPVTLIIPGGLSGTFSLCSIVDYNNLIAESVEGDNALASANQVTISTTTPTTISTPTTTLFSEPIPRDDLSQPACQRRFPADCTGNKAGIDWPNAAYASKQNSYLRSYADRDRPLVITTYSGLGTAVLGFAPRYCTDCTPATNPVQPNGRGCTAIITSDSSGNPQWYCP